MPSNSPQTELDQRFSSPGAAATPWADATAALETAEIFWIATVRANGRPHMTPLLAIWQDDALYFCTGETEQKAKNLARNPHCTLTTTSAAALNAGFDIMLEGDAVLTTDAATLRRLAERYAEKYGWTFTLRDGVLVNEEDGPVQVFALAPRAAFGFGRGETFTQTRWRF